MSNISGKLNLAALEHAIIKTKSGDEAIVIPIKKNHLFKSDKGNVYLDFSAREFLSEEKKTTHIASQSLPKEVYAKMKEAGTYAPTLGNLTDWGKLSGSHMDDNNPSEEVAGDVENVDDLPF